MVEWNELLDMIASASKLEMRRYSLGYGITNFSPYKIALISFFYIFSNKYQKLMKKHCMKCMIPSFPVHDVCCMNENDCVVNNTIARNVAKTISVPILKDVTFKVIDLYNLTQEGTLEFEFSEQDSLDFDFERFLSNRDMDDFNRAIRYISDERITQNIPLN